MSCTEESGTCHACRGACNYRPGWFKPGEAEKAAELLGLSLSEFFQEHLAVDWWTGSSPVFVLAPAIAGEETGTEYPGNPRGRCIFLQADNSCQIHDAKPFECAKYWCGASKSEDFHRQAAEAWEDHQDQITELLGREPVDEEYEGSIWSWLGL
jgi:Fe-S-cluster containining protein